MIYYVYEHKDPVTKEVVYIGYGSRDRAWKFPPISKNYPSANRQPEHILWMEEKTKQGYIVSEWVNILYKAENRDEVRLRETKLIKEFSPRFNLVNCGRCARKTIQEVTEMQALRLQGVIYQEIGKLFGVDRRTAKRYIDGISKPTSYLHE